MRQFKAALLAGVIFASALWPSRAGAVGWDSDDFIISGSTSFPDRIGVFDHDLTFKGYLDRNFLGVQGMDFDAAGRLVAVSSINPEVRVYDSSGAKVGGFTNISGEMGASGDIKVAPDGNYVLATAGLTGGARVFNPQGQFLRQFGSGTVSSVVFLPDNHLWIGGPTATISVFDYAAAAPLGTFSLNKEQRAAVFAAVQALLSHGHPIQCSIHLDATDSSQGFIRMTANAADGTVPLRQSNSGTTGARLTLPSVCSIAMSRRVLHHGSADRCSANESVMRRLVNAPLLRALTIGSSTIHVSNRKNLG